MLTTFYELFKATIDKTNNIYGIYKDYYERTLLNATTLEILELQNRYLFPTLLHR